MPLPLSGNGGQSCAVTVREEPASGAATIPPAAATPQSMFPAHFMTVSRSGISFPVQNSAVTPQVLVEQQLAENSQKESRQSKEIFSTICRLCFFSITQFVRRTFAPAAPSRHVCRSYSQAEDDPSFLLPFSTPADRALSSLRLHSRDLGHPFRRSHLLLSSR